MIHDIPTRLDKGIDDGTILTLPIFIAVRSGRSIAVNTVIDAGADVAIQAKSNLPSLQKDFVSSLDVAIHKHKIAVIEALLERGAGPIPHISEWPTHGRTYNYLRGVLSEESGVELPLLRDFKRLSITERKAIKY
jgi:hypothetical protein